MVFCVVMWPKADDGELPTEVSHFHRTDEEMRVGQIVGQRFASTQSKSSKQNLSYIVIYYDYFCALHETGSHFLTRKLHPYSVYNYFPSALNMLHHDDILIEPRDSIHKMLALEASAKCGDGEEAMASNGGVNSLWRQKVALWCYQVVDHLEEERATVYVAMNILDRFCSALLNRAEMDEHAYEVASMTALFLAVRIAGSGTLDMSELLPMSRKGISSQDIMLTGTSIIETLDLSKRILTPFDFITSLLDHLPVSLKSDVARLRESACYLAEMAVCDTVLSSCKASEVAFVALMNSIEEIVSRSEASIFGSTISKATDIAPSSSDASIIRRRLHGIYQKQKQISRSQCVQQAEAEPMAQDVQSPLVRVVSVDDLQEYSRQHSGMKRTQSEYSLAEDTSVKRSRHHA